MRRYYRPFRPGDVSEGRESVIPEVCRYSELERIESRGLNGSGGQGILGVRDVGIIQR
jgi:hypothetical protein